MPIYDYVCRSCGHIVEVVHGVHDAGPSICTNCGGQLRKAVSAPAIHFKGSGWAKKERTSKPAASKPASEGDKSGARPAGAATDTGSTSDSAKSAKGATSEAS